MDHASQRLFERTAGVEAERGFALLRDRAALRRLLENTVLKDAPDVERIALPLAEGEDERAPRLLVTREGRAVTCLGRGMPGRAAAVPWPRVAAHLHDQEQRLRAGIAEARLHADDTLAQSIRHGTQFGHRMTREEWDDLRTLGPLLVDLLDDNLQDAKYILGVVRDAARARSRISEERARMLWGFYMGCAHLLTAVAAEPDAAWHLLRHAVLGDNLIARRADWLLVNQPERTMALARDIIRDHGAPVARVVVPFLAVIAWRFSWHRKEAMALVDHIRAKEPGAGEYVTGLAEWLGEKRRIEHDMLGFAAMWVSRRSPLPTWGTAEQFGVDAARARASLREGMDFDEVLGRMGTPWARELLKWNPREDLHREPRLHPLEAPPDSITAERWETWRCALFDSSIQMNLQVVGGWALMGCAPIDALVPAREPLACWSAREGVRYLTVVLPRIFTMGIEKITARTVRKEEAAGRNEPCPCGSGKKFKKCCGGA